MITVVSGLPRAGTSLVMQMLAAGGLPALTDGARAPDPDNPRGYFEWDPVKRLRSAPALIDQAEGRAVKVVSAQLSALPGDRRYRVVFVERPLPEVVASQAAMLARRGTPGAPVTPAALEAALGVHLGQVMAWLGRQSNLDVAPVAYHALLARPRDEAERLRRFLGLPLDVAAMAAQVDASLHRQRQAVAPQAEVAPAGARR